MANKTMDFFKKRQANEPSAQNSLNANAQAQAQAMDVSDDAEEALVSNDMESLAQADKDKVWELTNKMLAQATDQQKASTRHHLQSRLTAQQFAELQTEGKDPLIWWYQNQAFQALKQSSTRSDNPILDSSIS
jgi:hypothetical protein